MHPVELMPDLGLHCFLRIIRFLLCAKRSFSHKCSSLYEINIFLSTYVICILPSNWVTKLHSCGKEQVKLFYVNTNARSNKLENLITSLLFWKVERMAPFSDLKNKHFSNSFHSFIKNCIFCFLPLFLHKLLKHYKLLYVTLLLRCRFLFHVIPIHNLNCIYSRLLNCKIFLR
jgi:hypothetical protein